MRKTKIALSVATALAVGYGTTALAAVDFNIGGQVYADATIYSDTNTKLGDADKVNTNVANYSISNGDTFVQFKTSYTQEALKASAWFKLYTGGKIRYNMTAESKIDTNWTVKGTLEKQVTGGLGNETGNGAGQGDRNQYVRLDHTSGLYLLAGRKVFFDAAVTNGAGAGLDYKSSSSYLMEITDEARFNALNVGFNHPLANVGVVVSRGNLDNAYTSGLSITRGFGSTSGFDTESTYFVGGTDQNILTTTSTLTAVSQELTGAYFYLNPIENLQVDIEAVGVNKHTNKDVALGQGARNLGKLATIGKTAYLLAGNYTIALGADSSLTPFLNVVSTASKAKVAGAKAAATADSVDLATLDETSSGIAAGLNYTFGNERVRFGYGNRTYKQKGDAASDGTTPSGVNGTGVTSYKNDVAATAIDLTYRHTFGKSGGFIDTALTQQNVVKKLTVSTTTDTETKNTYDYSTASVRFGYEF